MRDEEFEIMARAEVGHWWYIGLRRVIAAHWKRFAPAGRPRLLDAGCGTGAVLQALAAEARPLGIDVAPAAVRWCRRRGLARTAVASATQLPFADGAFDVVLSNDVLCHAALRDRPAALTEMARVLRPGGLLMMNLPAYGWLLSSHDTAVSNDRRFTRGEIVAMLRAARLAPLRATYWNTLLFPIAAAVRLARRAFPARASDLAGAPVPRFNGALSALLAAECFLIDLMPLPFGLSIYVVARKT